jgi:fibronectin-binding autotransporter adhesin
MVRQTWIQRLTRRSSQAKPSSAGKRPAFSPVKLEYLEDRNAPATLTWTGTAGPNWSAAGNWTGGGVPSAVNNDLIFNSTGVTNFTSNNDIAGLTGLTITITDASATAGNDFTINSSGATGIATLSNNKTDGLASATTINAQLSGTGATITAAAGHLDIANAANTFNAASSLNVPTGGTATIKVSPTSSVGDALVNVTGGTLNLGQGTQPTAPGLYWDVISDGFFQGPVTPSGTLTNAIGAGLSENNEIVIDDLNPAGIRYWVRPDGSEDNMTYVYQGQIFDADGIFSFGENIDDSVLIRIDGVEYLNTTAWNTPETTTTRKPDNDFGMGPTGDGWHDIDIRLGEFGGGAGAVGGGGWTNNATNVNGVDYPAFGFGFSFDGTGGSDGTLNIPVDSAQKVANGAPVDIQLRHKLPSVAINNSVSVSGNSTINILSAVTGDPTFANLNTAAGASLNVTAGSGAKTLKFSGTTTLAGAVTLSPAAGTSLQLGGKITGAGGFTKTGAGALRLSDSTASSDYTGANVVNAGIVYLNADTTLGATSAGTTVNAGGQLAIRANYNAAEPLTIQGGSVTPNSGFEGKYYSGTMNIGSSLLPDSGVGLGIESQTLVATKLTPRVDFGADAQPFDTTTAAGYAIVAGTGGAPLDRGGPAGYPAYNAFGGAGVDPGSNDNIGGVWTGNINVPVAGTYRFTTRSDDGSRLWIDNNASTTAPVVDNNFDQGMTNRSGEIALTAGVHTIKIGFYEGGGGWGMQAFWERVGDPSFPRHVINDFVYDGGNAVSTGTTFGQVAPLESNGNFNFNGPITLAGNAFIQGSGGTLTLNGGINIGGFDLTMRGGGTVRVATVGISGTGKLHRLDGGTTELAAANTFSGGNEIESGKVTFSVDPGAGLVHVTGQGSLVYIGATNLTFAGPLTLDSNANIASRNARLTISAALPTTGTLVVNAEPVNDNYVIFTAPLALTENLKVQVGGGGGNGGVAVFAGVISGGFGINKTGNGVLALAGNNTYTGTNTVVAGTLAAASPNGFGATSAGTVANPGASIGVASDPAFGGDFTLNPAEPLTFSGAGFGGNGALVNIQGNNTISSTLAPIGLATSIGSISGTLNLTSNLAVSGTLTFAGPGNVNSTGVISNGPAPTLQPGIFETIWNDVVGDAQNNINAYLSAAVGAADGTGVLQGNLDYPNDASFTTRAAQLGAVGFNDDTFSALWLTTFTPNESGAWGFRFANVDDNVSLWVDADRNGTFEDAEKFYSRGCCGGSGDQVTPDLTAGQNYLLGIPLSDTGGGGYLTNVQFNSPTAAGITGGNWATISPTTFPNTFRILPTVGNAVAKTGTGTATLSGNNTYTGPTTISGGTLAAASNTALGPVAGGTTVKSGGTLQFTNIAYSTLEPVTLTGTGALVGTGTSSFAGPINTPGPSTPLKFANHQIVQPNPDSTITVGGAVGRYVRVYQNLPNGSDGWLSLAEVEVLDGTATNVAVGKPASQTSEGFGGTADRGNDGNTSGQYGDNSVTHSGTDARNNWWQVDLEANVAISEIHIWNRTDCCSGRLRDYYVFVSDVPFKASDTIDTLVPSDSPSIGTVAAGDSLTLTGPITINSNLTTVTFNGPGTVNANSVIAGAGGVGKAGTGTATLSGNNTYAGTTTVNGGTLSVASTTALGPVAGGTVVKGGALQFTNLAYPGLEPVTLSGTGALVGTGTSSFAGPINVAAGPTTPLKFTNHQTVQPNPSSTITVGGAVGRYVRVYQNLPNGNDGWLSLAEVQVLDGTSTNVAVGHPATQANEGFGGTADRGNDGNTSGQYGDNSVTHSGNPDRNNWWEVDLEANVAISEIKIWNRTDCCSTRLRDYYVFVSDVPFQATDTIDSLLVPISAPSAGTVAAGDSLTLTGPITINSGSSSLTFNGPGAVTVNGVITGEGFVGKSGGGTATLSAANTYLGPTTVNGGTLLATNTTGSATGTGAVGVAGTGILGGTGTVGGATASAGSVAPGVNLGILKTGNLALAAGSNLRVDVNGATAGTNYDQVNVTGTVNLTGSQLVLQSAFGSPPTVGSTYTIISNDGADAVTGTFLGLASGATVFGNATAFTISYTGGDGNDVVLTTSVATIPTTTTTLVATPLATTGGSLVSFKATVAPSPGAAGTVTFLDNGAIIPGGANVALVGGEAVFSTSTLSIGTHPVTAYYSGATGFGSSISNVQNVVIGDAVPTVESVTVNGTQAGFTGAQRSRVVNLTVAFSQPVQLDAGAITLGLHANVTYDGTALPGGMGTVPTLTVTPSSDNKTFTVTFTGAVDPASPPAVYDGFNSLRDGVYDYTIDATKVHPLGQPGTNLSANSTGTFHRLYGDSNAPTQAGNTLTAVVNTGDNLGFRNAFNKPVGGGYIPYFDFNGDGTINSGDNLQFRNRFNKALSWTV